MTFPPLLRAVVLRTRPFSETSLWVRLYSETHGKLTGIAKGGRKGKERIFSPLLEVEVRGYPPRAAEHGLWNLARPEVLFDWRSLAAMPDRMAYAFALLELCDRLLEEAEPHPGLYHSPHAALGALVERPSHATAGVLLWFLIRLSDVLGYTIQYQVCPRCENPLVYPVGPFAREAGGVICQTCSPGESGAMARPVWEALVTLADAEHPVAVPLDLSVRDALLDMLTQYLAHHSERPVRLKSLDLLSEPGGH